MSIGSVKPFLLEPAAQADAVRTAGGSGNYAEVARSVAAGDLEGARQALPQAATGSPTAATLSQSLAAGNLAAARLTLTQLGAAPPASVDERSRIGVTQGSTMQVARTAPAVTQSMRSAAVPSSATAAGATNAQATAASASTTAGATASNAGRAAMVVADVGAATAGGTSYSVADIMLALATGNAGSIPADVINLYGPGGARYDPAAIMDAYRNSDIGKAQMALFAWMGKQA